MPRQMFDLTERIHQEMEKVDARHDSELADWRSENQEMRGVLKKKERNRKRAARRKVKRAQRRAG